MSLQELIDTIDDDAPKATRNYGTANHCLHGLGYYVLLNHEKACLVCAHVAIRADGSPVFYVWKEWGKERVVVP